MITAQKNGAPQGRTTTTNFNITNSKRIIKLEELELTNFKGIRHRKISLDGDVILISGDNNVGKTTINDAYHWLLFNHDSDFRTDFNIKTLDEDNNVIPGIEHTVEAVLNVDGQRVDLKKQYLEIWKTMNGETDKRFSGHEIKYFFNHVEMRKKDYEDKLNNLLELESWKILTNPNYFLQKLDWKKRREVLFKLSGTVSAENIIERYPKFKVLEDTLSGMSTEEIRKGLMYQRKEKNKVKETIPAVINELERMKKDVRGQVLIEEDIQKQEKLISDIREAIEIDAVAISDKQKRFDEIYQLKQQHMVLQNEIRKKILDDEMRQKREESRILDVIEDIDRKKAGLEPLLKKLIKDREDYEEERMDLLNKHAQVQKDFAKKLTDAPDACPYCGKPYTEYEKANLKKETEAELRNALAEELKRINKRGAALNEMLKTASTDIESVKERIQNFEKDKEKQQELLSSITSTLDIRKEKEKEAALEEKIKELESAPKDEVPEYEEELREEEAKLDALKRELNDLEENERIAQRIQEKLDEERNLGLEIASIEETMNLLNEYVNTAAKIAEEQANGLFSYIQWKLFDVQTNGGIKETCEPMVNGVPYADVNTAGKINAGLDIINTLSEFYGVYAPTFVDQQESIVHPIEKKGQVVYLAVEGGKDFEVRSLS